MKAIITQKLLSQVPMRLFAIAFIALWLCGCDHKRSDRGPWEYAELSSTQVLLLGKSSSEVEIRFDTGGSGITETSYSDLIKELWKKEGKQDCSTAVLDELDRDGWELVTHSIAFSQATMVAGYNSGETKTCISVWTLRRAK